VRHARLPLASGHGTLPIESLANTKAGAVGPQEPSNDIRSSNHVRQKTTTDPRPGQRQDHRSHVTRCWAARSMVDHVGVVQVISASRWEWIVPFTGLESGQFGKLVRVVALRGGEEIADGRPGRRWALPLADRVLLIATYWRTNLTMRQIGPLFRVSHAAAHCVIDMLGRCRWTR
jgi:hypothetical protein